MMALRIAAREVKLILLSPMAWLVLALAQLVGAWWFLLLVEQYRGHYEPLVVRVNSPMGVNDLVVLPFFGSMLLLGALLLGAALMAMRLIAEERRSGSLQLLYSSPVGMLDIVIGKYLAGFAFLALLALPWLYMPLTLALGTALDTGRLLSAFVGVLLLGGVLASVAVYASSLTMQPAIAAALTVGIGVALMGLNAGSEAMAGREDALAQYLGLLSHYEPLVQGMVSSTDLIYFLLLITGFLVFTVRRLDALRMQS
ncbi:MAG: ABC transporter permease subunit [Aquisalimonadaceae bacterium]